VIMSHFEEMKQGLRWGLGGIGVFSLLGKTSGRCEPCELCELISNLKD